MSSWIDNDRQRLQQCQDDELPQLFKRDGLLKTRVIHLLVFLHVTTTYCIELVSRFSSQNQKYTMQIRGGSLQGWKIWEGYVSVHVMQF